MYLYQEKQQGNMMRLKYVIFTLIAVMSGTIVFCQTGSTGTRVSATVVEPYTVTKAVELDFETVAIIMAGIVEMVPSEVKAKSAEIPLPVTTGTYTIASFVIPGATAYTYKITIPQASMEVRDRDKTLVVGTYETDSIIDNNSELLAGVFVYVTPMNVTVNYN